MMKTEIRIDSSTFDVDRGYRAQMFSIGHESCVVKFFKVTQEQRLLDFISRQHQNGCEVRLITPFVPETHLAAMKERLNILCNLDYFADSVVIVNDLGLMSAIHKMNPDRRICLGRSMLFSFDRSPWGTDIYASESETVQTIVRQVNFYDDNKIKFFKSFNVTEIEADLTAGTSDSLRKIQALGFKVNIHADLFLYGTQRSCFVKRMGICDMTTCDRFEKINPMELWEAGEFYAKLNRVNLPDILYLRGNQILGPIREMPHDFDGMVLTGSVVSL